MVFQAGEIFVFCLWFANLTCALVLLGVLAGVVAMALLPELEKIRFPFRYLMSFLVAVLIALFVPVFYMLLNSRSEAVIDAREFFRCFIALMGAITAFWFFDSWFAPKQRVKYLGAGVAISIFLVYLFSSPELFGEPLSSLPRWAVSGLLQSPGGPQNDRIYYSLDSLSLFFRSLIFSVPAYAVLLVCQTVMIYWNKRPISR